ncbi:MAG: hypothetical protein QNJ51_11810 [Calothrix sp. MO_167.B12]|nr:hypothetical protein [Calothrix sp. MO_167.B12]
MSIYQANNQNIGELEIVRRNIAAIGLLVSFFGFITSSFVFAVISGEEELTPKANQMAFFAGAGFSLSMTFLFWSIATFLKAFLVDEISTITYKIFPLFLILNFIYVVSSILDNIHIFDRRKPILREYLILIIPSLLVIAASYLSRFILNINSEPNIKLFYSLVWLFLIVIIVDNILSVLCSTLNDNYRINICLFGFWILIHSVLISVVIAFI